MTVYKQRVETMIRIEDYSDEELIEEFKDRGFAIYKGEECCNIKNGVILS